MKIGLDFDGVIANTGLIKSRAVKKMFNKELPISRTKKEVAVGQNILTEDEYRAMQLEIYKNFSWLLETPPIFDAIESIKFLVGKGHELKIITSRYPDAKEHIENWLTNHSINIPLVCIGHGISKADEAKLLDVFVDDSVKKLTELEGVVPNKFLFTQPYNSEDVLIKQIYRINNWKDLLSKIETLLTDPIV